MVPAKVVPVEVVPVEVVHVEVEVAMDHGHGHHLRVLCSCDERPSRSPRALFPAMRPSASCGPSP